MITTRCEIEPQGIKRYTKAFKMQRVKNFKEIQYRKNEMLSKLRIQMHKQFANTRNNQA